MANNIDKNEISRDVKELSQLIEDHEKKIEFFKVAIGTLLVFIKEFSLDLSEINADGFKEDIDRLSEKIASEAKLRKVQSDFENRKKTIFRYSKRLKRYVDDREKELKGIIDLLIKAMVTLDSDNEVFNQKIYNQSEKIEKITLLDDIKKIKSALELEITSIREAVEEKQRRDKEHLKGLAKKVDILNVELEKTKNESLVDGLTGAYNRLGFDRKIKNLVERNTITKAPFCLLLLDIDSFKEINDQYGHPIGDRVLLAFVQKCNEEIRKDDFVARMGGDEFSVILPGASLRNATKKAKQLCKNISSTRYALTGSDDSQELSFSVSIGIGAYRDGDTVASLMDRTDKALYNAKHSGKARVSSEKEVK